MNVAAAVYAWERGICPSEPGPVQVSIKRPFTPEFIGLYRNAWAWGIKRFAPTGTDLPELRFSPRLRRACGLAGWVWVKRDGERFLVPGITLAFSGITNHTLLHEVAHLLVGAEAGHGPEFCRAALDLYVRFLGVDEARALSMAESHSVRVAPPCAEARAA